MRYTGYNLVSFQRCTCITLFEKSLWQSGDVLMWHCTAQCDIWSMCRCTYIMALYNVWEGHDNLSRNSEVSDTEQIMKSMTTKHSLHDNKNIL